MDCPKCKKRMTIGWRASTAYLRCGKCLHEQKIPKKKG